MRVRKKKPASGRVVTGALAGVMAAVGACAGQPRTDEAPAHTHVEAGALLLPEEKPYLTDLRQLTFGGENAEAYWSFDGAQLSLQARRGNAQCDRIFRVTPPTSGRDFAPDLMPVSSGKGATTCAHFFPDGNLLYSSTHLAGDACPPRPDMSRGYVWALYDSYDIFTAKPDGSDLRPLTKEKGYDAEATVCARDGSIVFTSTRDRDVDLYRMDRDGKNVKRLTSGIGYDGGAFFNRDCSKIVWRSSRPRPGKEQEEYKALLAQGLVRPSKMELWTANADGSDPAQLTYLDAASFAPFFHPTDGFIVFSSNYGDPKGREFNLWAIRPDGTGLRRITHAAGFDGFPHFSPDGQTLAFSSNRAAGPPQPGRHDTNLFVARWLGLRPSAAAETSTDRIAGTIAWLADPAREGRGVGTKGLNGAGAFLEKSLQELGLEPAGDGGGFRQEFPVTVGVDVSPSTHLDLGGRPVARADFSVLGFSASGSASGALVLAGYGLVDKSAGLDDYAGLDVKDKVVLVRRFVPESDRLADASLKRRLGDIRHKAWLARERGARALIVTDWPLAPTNPPADWKAPPEAPLIQPGPEGPGDAGIPVLMIKRAAVEPLLGAASHARPVRATLDVALSLRKVSAFNVVGRIHAGGKPGAIVIGAHYDHLGFGGRYSLAPDKNEPHVGADDNASGTATVLEVARALMGRRSTLGHDVLVTFFSGEETGLLGSSHFVRARDQQVKGALAMINLDMVGRLRSNRAEVLGAESAGEWNPLVATACAAERIDCPTSGDGFGPSDQAAFYGAGVPVLHFFTGAHTDYHKPSDTAAKINAAGAAAIARVVERVVAGVDSGPLLTYRKGKSSPVTGGDMRSFSVSLGTIPDYGGPPGGAPGVLLAGVRPGGGADKAGMKRGDILIRLGVHAIRTVEDLMYALNSAKAGDTVNSVVVRDGKELQLQTTFQERQR